MEHLLKFAIFSLYFKCISQVGKFKMDPAGIVELKMAAHV